MKLISTGLWLLLLVAIMSAVVSPSAAQFGKRHIYVPNNGSHVLDLESMSTNVTLLDTNIWLHNPTDKYLYYQLGGGQGWGEAYLYLRTDDPSETILLGPGDSASLYFVGVGGADNPMYGYYDVYYGEDDNFTINSISEQLDYTIKVTERADGRTQLYPNQMVYRSHVCGPFQPREYFINDQQIPVTITYVFALKGGHYTVSGMSSPLPKTITKGQTFSVDLSYGSPDLKYLEEIGAEIGDSSWYDIVYIITQTDPNGSFSSVAEEKTDAKLMAYPNPAKSTLEISSGSQQMKQVTLYSMTGSVVRSQSIIGEATWDISNLAEGAYMLGAIGEPLQMVHIIK